MLAVLPRPKLDGSIPKQNGQVKDPFTRGAHLHTVMVPAAKVDMRCFHPLLLNVLFVPEGMSKDGKLVSAESISEAARFVNAAGIALGRLGVPPLFFDIMSESFLQESRVKLRRLPSSTCHAASEHFDVEDAYQHLLVARLFWVMHNQPLSLYNDTLRKQMAYQQGVSLYKTLFPGPRAKLRWRVTGESYLACSLRILLLCLSLPMKSSCTCCLVIHFQEMV